jgi:hypothetical protein
MAQTALQVAARAAVQPLLNVELPLYGPLLAEYKRYQNFKRKAQDEAAAVEAKRHEKEARELVMSLDKD